MRFSLVTSKHKPGTFPKIEIFTRRWGKVWADSSVGRPLEKAASWALETGVHGARLSYSISLPARL